jgi:hypothetical protein
MKARIINDENGDQLLILLQELIQSGLFLEGDEVSISVINECIVIKNLSYLQMRVSRFKRNLNSLIKNINNDNHPLNRVIVRKGSTAFWVISHDKSKHREFFVSNFRQRITIIFEWISPSSVVSSEPNLRDHKL